MTWAERKEAERRRHRRMRTLRRLARRGVLLRELRHLTWAVGLAEAAKVAESQRREVQPCD